MTTIIKICKKHGELPANEIYINKKGWKICRICCREFSKKNRKNNPDKARKLCREWHHKNKEYVKEKIKNNRNHINDTQRKYYNSHKERYSELRKKPNRKQKKRDYDQFTRENLKDHYVKKIIIQRSFLESHDIPIVWVEAKRNLIKLKRELREKENEN